TTKIFFPANPCLHCSTNSKDECSAAAKAARSTGGGMLESTEDRTPQPSMLARTEEIQKQIQALSGRDLQLWSIGILVILVLTSGLLALILPNLVWTQRVIHVE